MVLAEVGLKGGNSRLLAYSLMCIGFIQRYPLQLNIPVRRYAREVNNIYVINYHSYMTLNAF